jgi:ubiquinone/menaquinone biosynthesis C-methylase UbiE
MSGDCDGLNEQQLIKQPQAVSLLNTSNKYRKVSKGFDFLAPVYDSAVSLFFGDSIYKSQIFFLEKLGSRKSILILGGGTGKLLAELEKHQQPSRICYVDISAQMIRKAKKRVLSGSVSQTLPIEFICGSYPDIPPGHTFDLIITPYVLDCLEGAELSALMTCLGERIAADGKWLFTDFNIPSSRFTRIYSKIATRLLYLFFNTVCGLNVRKLPDFSKEFDALQFQVDQEKDFCSGLLTTKIYSRP